MENQSPTPSRAGADTSGRKKPWHWALLFSLLQMGPNSPEPPPLNNILKTWDNFDPQGLKIPYIWGFFALREDLTFPEIIPAGTSYQSVYPCHQIQFEHSLV